MAGRYPKPTGLKVIEGNRGKRATNKQEPDPEYLEAEDLAAPAWLDARGRAVWDELAPNLQKARLIAIIDVELLAMGCAALGQFRHAYTQVGDNPVRTGEIELEKEGEAAPPVAKGESLNPWLIVQSMSFKQACAILREFGVGPAARTRIALQPQMDLFGHGQKDKTEKYFSAH